MGRENKVFVKQSWAVVSNFGTVYTSTFASSRRLAIQYYTKDGQRNWAEMKQRGWQTAKITLTWEATQ